MRLSQYPYVTVRVECTRCPRKGSYRLARLAEKHGAEIGLPWLMEAIATGCKRRKPGVGSIYDQCGAFFPDIRTPRAPDEPRTGQHPPRSRDAS